MRRIVRRGVWMAGALCVLSLLLHGCFLFNQSPIARITVSALSGGSPLSVTFNATGSSDADGVIASYLWDFGDGETASGATVDHTFIAVIDTMVYTVTLTVIDDEGARDEASQSIEVYVDSDGGDGTGEYPVARLMVDRIIGRMPLSVAFDASDSTGGDAVITQYQWDFGDGATNLGSEVAHTYTPVQTSTFEVTLIVWNSNGHWDSEQIDIVVIVPDAVTGNEDPEATFTNSDPDQIYASDSLPSIPSIFEVTFDPRGSYADAGHAIDYYAWDFGDGDLALETTDVEVTHFYELRSQTHTYIVTLTVFDDQGLSGTVARNVTLTN